MEDLFHADNITKKEEEEEEYGFEDIKEVFDERNDVIGG